MLAIFLDQETMGLDATKHGLIEVAFKVVDLTSGEDIAEYQSVIRQPKSVWERRDPVSVEINGFSWDEIQQGREIVDVTREIIDLFNRISIERGKAVFICQNPAFDRAFFAQLVDVYTHEELRWPYHWLDLASMFWVLQMRNDEVVPRTMNLSKDEIAKHYNLPSEERPHRAMNGVNHLILCYDAVVQL